MKRRYIAAAVLAAAAIAVLGAASVFSAPGSSETETAVREALADDAPANVILLVGDGMGTQEITAARYYQGVTRKLNVDRMPLTGFDTTWSVRPAPAKPYPPDYDPDSAATATMWATGQKTIDERLSQGPSSDLAVPGKTLETILEVSQGKGMKVGDVSTAEITDATPAALASHISVRGCEGPADMGACPQETKGSKGLGSIAEQEVDHHVDVLLGGGRSRFTQTIGSGPYSGRTVLESALAQNYRYVSDTAGLGSVKALSKPVLGLFADDDMSLEWSGPAATLGKGSKAVACSEGQRPANEPSLADMTSKAIKLLENPNGFFLQVEGASIDKEDHATNACGQIGETVAFDRSIGVALDYQKTHPDTLVIATADHAQTSQIVSADSSGAGIPTGYSTNLLTKDGQTLTLTYGTSGFTEAGKAPRAVPPGQQHTGAVVPVWGRGPGSLRVLGTNDHTSLFKTLGG